MWTLKELEWTKHTQANIKMEWLAEREKKERAIAGGTLVHTARYVPAVWRKWLRCWTGRGRGHIGEESRAHSCGTHGHSNRVRQEERDQKRGTE